MGLIRQNGKIFPRNGRLFQIGAAIPYTPPAYPSSLKLFLKFDEPSGTSLKDETTNANDGTIIGTAVRATGRTGTGLQLDGTGQRAEVPDHASLDITGNITLAAWIKPTASGSAMIIIKKGETGVADGYEISVTSTAKVMIRLNQVTASTSQNSNATIPNDGLTWMHVAATYDGDVLRTYINGTLDKSTTVGALTIGSNNLAVAIGGSTTNSTRFLGIIDDVRIYDVALSDAEIADIAS